MKLKIKKIEDSSKYLTENFNGFSMKFLVVLKKWGSILGSFGPNENEYYEVMKNLDIQELAHALRKQWKEFFVVNP